MNDSNQKIKEPKYEPPIHSFPIYGLILCAIILIFSGIYMYLNNVQILGKAGNDPFGVNGPTSICFGIILLIYPIYTLIKQFKEKK